MNVTEVIFTTLTAWVPGIIGSLLTLFLICYRWRLGLKEPSLGLGWWNKRGLRRFVSHLRPHPLDNPDTELKVIQVDNDSVGPPASSIIN